MIIIRLSRVIYAPQYSEMKQIEHCIKLICALKDDSNHTTSPRILFEGNQNKKVRVKMQGVVYTCKITIMFGFEVTQYQLVALSLECFNNSQRILQIPCHQVTFFSNVVCAQNILIFPILGSLRLMKKHYSFVETWIYHDGDDNFLVRC